MVLELAVEEAVPVEEMEEMEENEAEGCNGLKRGEEAVEEDGVVGADATETATDPVCVFKAPRNKVPNGSGQLE